MIFCVDPSPHLFWSLSLSFALLIRAAIFLKAADLISTRYRAQVIASTMVGQVSEYCRGRINGVLSLLFLSFPLWSPFSFAFVLSFSCFIAMVGLTPARLSLLAVSEYRLRKIERKNEGMKE